MALMRDNKTWELAIIMEVRCKPSPDSDDESPAETTQSTEKQIKTEMKSEETPKVEKPELNHHRNSEEGPKKEYQYYVNYLQLERRNNRWISEDMIDTNAELISKALDKYEKDKKAEEAAGQKFLENDVHYGSSQLEVNDFLEGTRLKTIEFI
jgi:hypothetical protein